MDAQGNERNAYLWTYRYSGGGKSGLESRADGIMRTSEIVRMEDSAK